MNKIYLTIIISVLFLLACSCAAPIDLGPLTAMDPGDKQVSCAELRQQDPWAASFTINGVFPGGRRMALIGVNRFIPASKRLECVLLSVEGLAVFSGAVEDGLISVTRALPPFDAPGFAQGLLDDVELMFLQPSGPPDETGYNSEGLAACRWKKKNGNVVEVNWAPNGDRITRLFNDKGRLRRRVVASWKDGNGPPDRIKLEALHGWEYSLSVELLEKER